MKITLLGTATSQGIPVIGCDCATCISDDPRDKRLRCAALVEGDNHTLVIDVGPDFRAQMLRADVKDLDAVLLTHEHNDHVIGLDDLRPFIFRRRTPMRIYAEQRVLDEIKERFKYAFEEHAYPGAPKFELLPIHPGDTLEYGDMRITALRVHHGRLPILAFKINQLAYLTDTKTIPQTTLNQIQDIDVLILDALRREQHHSHNTLDEAIAQSKAVKADKTYLIHMSHILGPTASWEQDLPAGVYPSYDGLSFEF